MMLETLLKICLKAAQNSHIYINQTKVRAIIIISRDYLAIFGNKKKLKFQ